MAYWLALILALAGGTLLMRKTETRALAWALLFFAISLTVLNLPFAMETRHRLPMMDPLITALSGGGWLWFKGSAEGSAG